MTEAEWLTGGNPQRMFEHLGGGGSGRKMRLFSAHAFRSCHHLFFSTAQRSALDRLEELADEGVPSAALREVTANVRRAIPADAGIGERDAWHAEGETRYHYAAVMLYRELVAPRPGVHAIALAEAHSDPAVERLNQSRLLREVFGNPFRPIAFNPAWHTAVAVGVAEAIYAERAFDRLPILADALQDAGCEDADILSHLRSHGPHVRGCWALDLVLRRA